MHALPAFLSSLSAFFLVTIISRLSSPSFFASYIAILVVEQLFQILHVASIVEPFSIDISLNQFRTSRSNLLLEYIILTVFLCSGRPLIRSSRNLILKRAYIAASTANPIMRPTAVQTLALKPPPRQ